MMLTWFAQKPNRLPDGYQNVFASGTRGEEVGISASPVFYERDSGPPELNIYYYMFTKGYTVPSKRCKRSVSAKNLRGRGGGSLFVVLYGVSWSLSGSKELSSD